MRAARRVVPSLLVAALALLHPVTATAGTPDADELPSPSLTASPEPPTVPADVAAWFAEQGLEAAAEAGLGEPEDLTLGVPRQVAEWSEDYIAGEQLEQPAAPVQEWLAPVVPRAGDAPEPVGVVHAGADGDGVGLVEVTEDTELAAALHRLPGPTTFVRGTSVEGWFGIVDGEVWPVTEGARTVLQGALPPDVFQEFLAAWLGRPTPTAPPGAVEENDDDVSPLIPIGVIVLLGAGVAWLLLRQYRRADSRIAADVRAGLAPPREEGDGPRDEDDAPERDGG